MRPSATVAIRRCRPLRRQRRRRHRRAVSLSRCPVQTTLAAVALPPPLGPWSRPWLGRQAAAVPCPIRAAMGSPRIVTAAVPFLAPAIPGLSVEVAPRSRPTTTINRSSTAAAITAGFETVGGCV